jgi:DNA-directed RNA polymerase specialized sigma subunit
MSDIVIELKKRNWSDTRIAKELGMDEDEILRLCQVSGLVEVFADTEFSEAWEAEIFKEEDFVSLQEEDING